MTWSKVWLIRFACVVTLTDGGAYAQSGSTGLYSTFDPTRATPAPPLPLPPGTLLPVIHNPVISPEEYQQRKDTTGKAYAVSGPPGLLFSRPTTQTLSNSLAPAPTINFEGVVDQTYQPPSPNLAAGPQDLILIVNSTVARYDRAGNLTNQLTLRDWFQAQLPQVCSSVVRCLIVDPSIRYDHIHGRFLLVAEVFDDFAGTSYLMLSVSNGATFAGGWRNWALNARLDGQTLTNNWSDFPQVGYDDKAIYISSLQFTISFSNFVYSKVRIIRKADLYNAFTTFLTYRDITDLRHEDGSKASTLQPVVMRGGVGAGNSYYLVSATDNSPGRFLTLFRIDDPVGNPRVSTTTLRGVVTYAYPVPAFQANTFYTLDTGQSSILKAVWRDGVIYTAQNVATPDANTTVLYSRIDTRLLDVTQQAQWVNGTYFYPAFDVPASHGRVNGFPNKLITGSTTDATGALASASLTDVKTGEAPFNVIANGVVRWGDYFGGDIDPILGGLWVSGQYAKAQINGFGQYGVRNAYFPLVAQDQFNDVAANDSARDYINTMALWALPFGCSTPGGYCPASNVTKDQLAVHLIRLLYGDNFAFTTTPYFTDVPDGTPIFPYVQKARDLGLIGGCTPTTFCPSNAVTRTDAAVAVINAKMSALFGAAFSGVTAPYFTDVAPSDAGFAHVQKMRELGITAGCSATTYCATRTITRRELAVFLVRGLLH
ncbi:MAG: S-layer homology domain-containing protein [Acidobacteria bacterium]|nr:S-layer homology domain-containing protein [Acidobacteriota bacterium]